MVSSGIPVAGKKKVVCVERNSSRTNHPTEGFVGGSAKGQKNER
jgi:hypothetical protein